MTSSTTCDSIDFDNLADAVDLALSNDEQDWLDSMSNTPGRGIRREYHFYGQELLDFDVLHGDVRTGSVSVKSDLSAWDDEFGTQTVPSRFAKSLILKNHRSFDVKILNSITLHGADVASFEISVSARINDSFSFYSWRGGEPEDRFSISMALSRLAVAEFCEQQEINRATAGEIIDYYDLLSECNEVRLKVVAGPFETMRQISDVLNDSGVGRICRFVTNKNLMAKGLDHDTSKEQLKSVLESRYRMVEWCSQAESFLPVSVFAHHKECLCKQCEYEHYTKISKNL